MQEFDLQMMSSMMVFLFLGLSVSMIYISSPLGLGLWVILMALLCSLVGAAEVYSWFGFMMFLIYIGGMLVMFAYFLAIEPNEKVGVTASFWISMIVGGIFLMVAGLMMFLKVQKVVWITSLFSSSNLGIMVFLGLVLFFALLSVVKVSMFGGGPLRPFMS